MRTKLSKFPSLSFFLFLFASNVLAEADGPDFYKVRNVASDDVLNMRVAPYWQAEKIGEIPPDGQCIRNMGCRGGLTYNEFVTLNETEKKQLLRRRPRWCQVEFQGRVAWVAGRYLAEGDCPSSVLEQSQDKLGQNKQEKVKVDPLNFSYLIEGETVKLIDGREIVSIAGSSSQKETQIQGASVFGDFDSDDKVDAVSILISQSGGSGSFYYLALASLSAKKVPAIFIGDRIKVKQLSVEKLELEKSEIKKTSTSLQKSNKLIVLKYFDREAGQSMAEIPTLLKQRQFIFQKNRFQEKQLREVFAN